MAGHYLELDILSRGSIHPDRPLVVLAWHQTYTRSSILQKQLNGQTKTSPKIRGRGRECSKSIILHHILSLAASAICCKVLLSVGGKRLVNWLASCFICPTSEAIYSPCTPVGTSYFIVILSLLSISTHLTCHISIIINRAWRFSHQPYQLHVMVESKVREISPTSLVPRLSCQKDYSLSTSSQHSSRTFLRSQT